MQTPYVIATDDVYLFGQHDVQSYGVQNELPLLENIRAADAEGDCRLHPYRSQLLQEALRLHCQLILALVLTLRLLLRVCCVPQA